MAELKITGAKKYSSLDSYAVYFKSLRDRRQRSGSVREKTISFIN